MCRYADAGGGICRACQDRKACCISTLESWEALLPFSAGRVYVNDLGDAGEDRVREAYGPNYDRLGALKNTYDPTNFFRLNRISSRR